MSTETTNILNTALVLAFGKYAILIILFFYAIFSLIIIRQSDLMGKTLVTKFSPIIKAMAIIHSGVAIGLIVLAWGVL